MTQVTHNSSWREFQSKCLKTWDPVPAPPVLNSLIREMGTDMSGHYQSQAGLYTWKLLAYSQTHQHGRG